MNIQISLILSFRLDLACKDLQIAEFLDNLDIGTYYLVLKATYPNSEDSEKPIIKYYGIKNDTKYKETVYYTLSKYNNIITIDSNNEYNTLEFVVKKNNSKNKNYDVTIDPGHGGMDGGGASGNYKETDFNDKVDPVGAVIGEKGNRINRVLNQLNGEKIDVILYDKDPVKFIANALNPAQDVKVTITDEKKKEALAIVNEENSSLAIGKKGINIKLASRLTRYKIVVKKESDLSEE